MPVYAIADLHLPARQKPMDVFGEHWKDHFQRIREDWQGRQLFAMYHPASVIYNPGLKEVYSRDIATFACRYREETEKERGK